MTVRTLTLAALFSVLLWIPILMGLNALLGS